MASADLATRLQLAIVRIHRHTRPSGVREGLSPTQLAVLGTLVHAGPQRSGDVATREGLNATLVSRVLAKLEEAGLARRSADVDDRRVARVEATARGRRLLDKEQLERASALRGEIEQLAPEHRRALADALDALEALGERLKARPR
ncbi:MAG: MarR family transcriptional regulator [Actinomycetota bacterium]|nr:MarR family transcriptional regulator [Actinomycetota bacterium]